MPKKRKGSIGDKSSQAKCNAVRRRLETATQTDQRRSVESQRNAEQRAAETVEQAVHRRSVTAERQAVQRAAETVEQTVHRRSVDAERQAVQRAAETVEQTVHRRSVIAERQAMQRAAETVDEMENRQAHARRRDTLRRHRHVPRSKYVGRRLDDVLTGLQIVAVCALGSLLNPLTGDILGVKCEHCAALKWLNEPKGMCCRSNQVKLDPLFDVNDRRLQFFHDLWTENSAEAKLFRKYITALNNALSLASLKVDRMFPPGRGWVPSVIIQGKVAIQFGPLRPSDGRPPVFCQLYVLDPDIADRELQFRLGTLFVNDSITSAERHNLEDLLEKLQNVLHEVNPYVADFKYACQIIQDDQPRPIELIIDANMRPSQEHARRFQQGFKEISVVMEDQTATQHDIVITGRGPGNHLQKIADTHRSVDSWRFVLFFPTGTDGWHSQLNKKQADINRAEREAQEVDDRDTHGPIADNTSEINVATINRCTGRMFYSYHLQLRHPVEDHFNPLFYGGKLLQEYVCLAMAKIENQELYWVKRNQRQLRAEKYNKLIEDISGYDGLINNLVETNRNNTENNGPNVVPDAIEEVERLRMGQLVILPASHTGSPRYMHSHYQDGVAIVREFRKPDLFITFTCNPQWPEIRDSLFDFQQSYDRPDLVARVFYQKLKKFHNDLITGQGFGRVAAHVNVVEFQKRGLPHNHLLLILDGESRIKTADDVDTIISAELPPDPASVADGVQKEQAEKLLDLVLNNMVHACSYQCRPEGHCKETCLRGFPKNFCEQTVWDESAYYPQYRRRPDREIIFKGKPIDNRWIVPYNPYFLLRYEAHINIECCISVASIKYLYKYVHKGVDRLMLAPALNEVETYQNLRSIGASEACWSIFQFPLTNRHPAVQALRIHLEEEQMVFFTETTARNVADEGPPQTELTAFFEFNKQNPETKVKYVDFPKSYVLKKSKKEWKRREKQEVIGRIHTVHPTSGDIFYLRILLHHDQCKGATSFADIRTVNGVVLGTFKDTCQALGLLQDDGEWTLALAEAALTKMAYQLRNFFVVLLLFCQPSNPGILFERHHMEWSDDIKRQYPQANNIQLRILILLQLERSLQEQGKELADFNLPIPDNNQRADVAILCMEEIATRDSVVMQEEENFDVPTLMSKHQHLSQLLNEQQHQFYVEVLENLRLVLNLTSNGVVQVDGLGRAASYFLDARGGTGKTFLLNTILAAARTMDGDKRVALAVASSGIAAILLHLGRTFHSRFKVPVKFVDENVTFAIKPNSSVGKVLQAANLIVWDEGPMLHRHLLEGLNRTLQDIMNCRIPFGGKLVIIAGDFRQVLPIIKKGTRAQVTNAAINKSVLWNHMKIRHLTENMRIGTNPNLQNFDFYLESLGNGQIPVAIQPDWIKLPEESTFIITNTSEPEILHSMDNFVDVIFPNLQQLFNTEQWATWISERAILAPKNSDVDLINNRIVNILAGQTTMLCSADRTADNDDATQYPVEFLNIQTPSGMPPHQLIIKEGIVVMLLRNLNPRKGLCNGTRLIVTHISKLLLHCRILNGDQSGETVFIPRIELTVDEIDMPIKWKRRQFPIRPAFAMTINKSQGQTLKKVGVWLNNPCFSHGQLYVASSRVGNPDHIHYAVNDSDENLTRNVVYKEALSL